MLQDSIRRRRRAFAFAVATALVDTMPLSACSFAFRAATTTGARNRRSILSARQKLLLMSTIGTSTDNTDHSEIDMSDFQAKRVVALHEQLTSLGIDAENLSSAATRSMTTTEGYDPYFGKSAIKAYRTFASPRPSKLDAAQREDVGVAAARCARQIDFLAKRHRSHEAEWVRHTDAVESSSHHDDDKGCVIGKTTRFPLTIVLDNVRSAFNVGSIFRTADACACAEIITTGITPHPGGSGAEKLAKSALGADRVVPSRHFATTMEAVDFFRNERPEILLVGMETTERSVCYTDVAYPGGIGMDTNGWGDGEGDNDSDEGISREMKKTGTALFLGNEVTGVDTEVMPLLDMVVEIPMFGTKNSLNIAACAPVVMYECIRQWKDLECGDGGGGEE
jgi:tRNA G18 (ribose-2'-O)-methylase SpoU